MLTMCLIREPAQVVTSVALAQVSSMAELVSEYEFSTTFVCSVRANVVKNAPHEERASPHMSQT
jgi:hypothetical protein